MNQSATERWGQESQLPLRGRRMSLEDLGRLRKVAVLPG